MDNPLRTDGVYQSTPKISEDPRLVYRDGTPVKLKWFTYLRFYDDGLVLGINTVDTPEGIVNSLNPHNDYDTGRYSLACNKIRFSLISREGTVDYTGFVEPERLVLDVDSHITGYKNTEAYTFVPLSWPF